MQKLLFALAVLLVGVFAPAQSTDAPDDVVIVTFGKEGDPGSFRAQFHKQGGGLVALQAMDHWKDVEAARRDTHETGDYMLLAYNGGDHALRLHGGGGAFPADLARVPWQFTQLPDGSVQFTLDGNGLRLVKTLRHDPKGRGLEIELRLENTGAEGGGELPLELLGAALTNPTTTSLVGNASFGIAVAADGTTVHVTPKVGAPQPLELEGKPLSFAGTTSRFFGSFLFPRDEAAGKALRGLQVDAVPPVDDAYTHTQAGQSTRMRYALALPIPAKGAGPVALHYGLYLGPKSYRVFETLPEPARFAPVLDVDLTSPCCVTIPFGKQMAELLLHLLGWFHDLIGNWGIAIMMLTVLVRGLLAPLNFHMQKSMRAYGAKMAKLKPKMDELKKRHEDDPKAYQQAMLAFQREHKVMPPLGGCLPIFLSMPVYIGLFTALRVAYDLRQQPFLFWIHDLSVSDDLAALPFYPHALNLLPIVWIVNTAYLTFRQPLPTDPQQRSVQRTMRFMPLMMGVLFYNYASGLMVYMVTSSLWTLVESAITKKILGPIDPNVASMAPTPM